MRLIEVGAYLAGLIDGEGCIGYYTWVGRNGRNVYSRIMTIGMTDEEVVDAAAECLDLLGVKYCRFYKGPCKGRKAVWTIQVTTLDGLRRIRETVPIRHLGKLARLDEAIASYRPRVCSGCAVPWDKRTRGCANCTDRHRYRRRREREGRGVKKSVAGITGRIPKNAPRVYGGAVEAAG